MEQIVNEIENKWILPNKTDDELKQIAKDLYNNKIFCDRHLSQYDRIESHFMVLIFMGPKKPEAPQYPSDDSNLQGSRDNKLYDLIQREQDQKDYEKALLQYPVEMEQYNEYLKTIGMVYEYWDSGQTSPMAVNGKPVFFSCRFLNLEDTKKMFEYFEQYKSIREQADNF
jgi:hypothetical protein